MQYVGPTGRTLKTGFSEHYRRIKKPIKRFDTFLYRHFTHTGHSPTKVSVQPVEKIIYDENFTSRFSIIKRRETELKWIKLYELHFDLVGMITYTMRVIFRKCLILMFSLFWNVGSVKPDLMVYGKMVITSANKRTNTTRTLNCLSKILKDHARHSMLSFLSSLRIK